MIANNAIIIRTGGVM